MSEPNRATGLLRPAMFRIRLKTWLLVIAIITCLVAWQSRRSFLTPTNVSNLSVVASIDEDIWEIAWSPERDRMALLGWEKSAVVRDVLSLQRIETIGEGQKLIHFALSPDKGVVAYCRNGKTAEILDRRTGHARTLDVGNDQPQMTFSPDGTTLATEGYGTLSCLWQVSDGKLLRQFDAGPTTGGLTPVFSPDGTMLAVGNRNAETHIFDVATGKDLHVLDVVQTQGLEFSALTVGPWRWPTSTAACGTSGIRWMDGGTGTQDHGEGTLPRRMVARRSDPRLGWPEGKDHAMEPGRPVDSARDRRPRVGYRLRFSPDGRNLITAGGPSGRMGTAKGKRSLRI